MSHTRTPWKAEFNGHYTDIGPAEGKFAYASFVSVHTNETIGLGPEERDANAAFIVKAVNAHDELVAALKGMTEKYVEGDFGFWDPERTDEVKAARAALAKAGETL